MEFYREGILNKAGKGVIQKNIHKWRPRYFVLDSLMLKYYKSKPPREALPEDMLGCIEVSEMESVSLMKNEKNAFQITTKAPARRTYYMSGRSEEEIQGWIKCIEMAKEKFLERRKKTPNEAPVPSVYDEVVFRPESPSSKPPRSLITSGTAILGSPQLPTSPLLSTSPHNQTSPPLTSPGEKPVPSAYHLFQFPSVKSASQPTDQTKQDEGMYAEPTYAMVDEKSASDSKKASTASAADVYDTVTASPTRKSSSKKMGEVSTPPPLPARLPSMSDEFNETAEEQKNEADMTEKQCKPNVSVIYEDIGEHCADKTTTSENLTPQPQEIAFGLYAEVGSLNSKAPAKTDSESGVSSEISNVYAEPGNQNTDNAMNCGQENTVNRKSNTENESNDLGLYAEVRSMTDSTETTQPKNDLGFYDEITDAVPNHTFATPTIRHDVASPDLTVGSEKRSEIPHPMLPDPTHVYAKPQKASSMKRARSKRKLIPGLMDVGEVEVDVELDAEGGKETLKKGMTKPQGDRFAIEDLREVLAEFDQELNNNERDRKMLPDFDVNQRESAFEVLQLFLAKYE